MGLFNFNFIFALFALVAVMQPALAGFLYVRNFCPYPVYWEAQDADGTLHTIRARIGVHRESYAGRSSRVLFVGKVPHGSTHLNIEYTVSSGICYINLSALHGYPFEQYGMSGIPAHTTPNCHHISCQPGHPTCKNVYGIDPVPGYCKGKNYCTNGCPADQDYHVWLCRASGTPSLDATSNSTQTMSIPVALEPSMSPTART